MYEYYPMLILAIFILLVGIYPRPVLEIIGPVCEQITNFIRVMGGLA